MFISVKMVVPKGRRALTTISFLFFPKLWCKFVYLNFFFKFYLLFFSFMFNETFKGLLIFFIMYFCIYRIKMLTFFLNTGNYLSDINFAGIHSK